MAPRIVRFSLSPDGSRIIAMKILEQRNPLFDGLTTGALVSDRLYYIANTQIDKVVNGKIKPHARLDPLKILLINIAPR
jgi:hypothetical protein